MRILLAGTMLVAAAVLAGCNTWRALGQDVKEVGGAVGETAETVGKAIGRGVERVGQSIQGAAESPREEVDRPRQ